MFAVQRSTYVDLSTTGYRCHCRRYVRSILSLAVLLAVAGGCSSGKAPTYAVTGTVKLPDGTPLTGGRLLFRPEGETVYAAKGEIGADGSFELSTFGLSDGAVAGTHKVMVLPPTPEGAMDDVRKAAASALRIDLRYQSLRTTPLEYTVTPGGTNHFDIVVEPLKVRK